MIRSLCRLTRETPGNAEIDPRVIRFVPEALAEELRIVPIGWSGEVVRLAVADWSSARAQQVEARLRRPVDAQIVGEHRWQIYRAMVYAPETVSSVLDAAARAICDRLLDGLTDELAVTACAAILMGLPWLRQVPHRPLLWSLLPKSLHRRRDLAPFAVVGDQLLIAVAGWLPSGERATIAACSGLSPRLVLAPVSEVAAAARAPGDVRRADTFPNLEALLKQKGLLSPIHQASAAELALRSGREFGEILLECGLIEPTTLLQIEAERQGIRALPPGSLRANSQIYLSPTLARARRWVPIERVHGRLVLAGPGPWDDSERRLAEVVLGDAIEPVLALASDLDRALAQWSPEVGMAKRLGAYLVAAGHLGQAKLQSGLFRQGDSGRLIGETLQSMGHLGRLDLLEGLSLQAGLPWLDLASVFPEAKAVHAVPESLGEELEVLGLIRDGAVLYLGTPSPLTPDLRERLDQAGISLVQEVLVEREALRARSDVDQTSDLTILDQGQRAFCRWLTETQGVQRGPALRVLAALSTGSSTDRALVSVLGWTEERAVEVLAKYRHLAVRSLWPEERHRRYFDPLGRFQEQRTLVDPVDVAAARLFNQEEPRRLSALPIAFSGETIVVAVADPLVDGLREEISQVLGRPFDLVVTRRSELEAAARRHLGQRYLGDFLIERGLITPDELERALDLARRTGVRLGCALRSLGFISDDQLTFYLAEQFQLPYFDLAGVQIDPSVAYLLPETWEREHGILPLSRSGDWLTVAITDPLDREGIAFVGRETGLQVEPVLATESELEAALEGLYREYYLTRSREELLSRSPDDSAVRVVTTPQKIAFAILGVLLVVGLAWHPLLTLQIVIGFGTTLNLIFFLYKFYLVYRAMTHTLEVDVSAEEIAALDESSLPVYTILVPLYREAAVIPVLIKAIARLDYPQTKLDVQLLLEEDDRETVEAARSADLPAHVRIVVVPDGKPKGKPKACNYGLLHARGEYVVIFDAEDVPDPDQLKKAIVAFQKSSPDLVCVQAKLNYYNQDQNLLTRWFTAEYSQWFDLFLPGLDATGAPIPLGGTSNHFRTDRLLELNGWDPYNVTEDADLGVRLVKLGGRTAVIDSTTYEEANSQLGNWIRQRSRWVKGYVLTWLVHMRHPVRLWRALGAARFFGFQLVVGGTFLGVLLNPFYWFLTAAWFLTHLAILHELFPAMVYYVGAVGLYVGNFAFTYLNALGCLRRGYHGLVRYALLSPIYWMLMSIAGWKGALQLIYKPSYWEKTTHGLYHGPVPLAVDHWEGA
ncbi:MAG TPA: glycosyltransferase [Chloroflexota bacterium]|nr:glycosyltransferase [Chloroflexota bacterium]